MELQLLKIARDYPSFFITLQNAINAAYKKAEKQLPSHSKNDILCMQRYGYYLLTNVPFEIRRAIQNAGFSNIEVKVVGNSRKSDYHIEIHTPYGIFMVAQGKGKKLLPKHAKYRQRYIDQTFMQEACPEYAPYTTDCIPLYVIIHAHKPTVCEPYWIGIGRLMVEQLAWSCLYPIHELHKGQVVEEKFKKKAPVAKEEIDAKKNRVRFKKA